MTMGESSLVMPPALTQKEVVLAALRQQPQGVCGVWFLDRRMPRYPARIVDLKTDGHSIGRVKCPYPYHTHAKSIATYRLDDGQMEMAL